MPRDRILESMVTGIMRSQAAGMSLVEKERIADYLAGDAGGGHDAVDRAGWQCSAPLGDVGRALWTRWGVDPGNQRYVADTAHSFRRDSVSRLDLQWAFGFPDAVRARSLPAVTEQVVYVGSEDGTVFALDRESGCVHWTFQAASEVRSGISIVENAEGTAETLIFGDFDGSVYTLLAATGELVWSRDVSDHPDTTLTGSVVVDGDRLIVPMSSTEILSAYSPDYSCCTFRGGVLALSAATGEELWRMYTTTEPTKRKPSSRGVQQWGPSGAPVWSAPTIDNKRGLVYFGTGENYSSPANDMSDAIIAVRRETGAVVWVQQTLAGDAWNGACVVRGVNCPEEDGPDFDFGAPPILAEVAAAAGSGGATRDYLLAGQKSGMIFGIDPDDGGRILWQRRLGMGGFNGGVHWGMTVSGNKLIVPITDTPGNRFTTGPPQPGLHALDIATGEPLWSTLHPADCTGKRSCYFNGLSAAPTSTDELVFAASLNGVLAAYDLEDGQMLWSFPTRREFETVNGVVAKGGSIDSGGAVVVGDQLFVNSGYDKWSQYPGNVLLAFRIEDPIAVEDPLP